MSRQFVRWALVATALTVFAGACGGDDKIEVDGSTAAGQVAGAAGASADAKALCKDSLEVAQAAAIVSADPSKAGELAKYSKTSEGLTPRRRPPPAAPARGARPRRKSSARRSRRSPT